MMGAAGVPSRDVVTGLSGLAAIAEAVSDPAKLKALRDEFAQAHTSLEERTASLAARTTEHEAAAAAAHGATRDAADATSKMQEERKTLDARDAALKARAAELDQVKSDLGVREIDLEQGKNEHASNVAAFEERMATRQRELEDDFARKVAGVSARENTIDRRHGELDAREAALVEREKKAREIIDGAAQLAARVTA